MTLVAGGIGVYESSPREKAYRNAKARFDPWWHREQARQATAAEDWFAAAFHFALLIKNDPEQAEFYDGLQDAYHELATRFEMEERDPEQELSSVVRESLKLPRGKKLPEIRVNQAQRINHATWEKVKTPDAFQQSPLTDQELERYRNLIRQHPRGTYYNTLATAECRMGNYDEAIEAALRSVALTPKEVDGLDSPFPGDYAVLAISYLKLGEMGKANDFRVKLNKAMQVDAFKTDGESKSFAAEVEEHFAMQGVLSER